MTEKLCLISLTFEVRIEADLESEEEAVELIRAITSPDLRGIHKGIIGFDSWRVADNDDIYWPAGRPGEGSEG